MREQKKQSRRATWDQWELTAIRYLQEKWYEIIETNYTIQWWEIDIIAKEGDVWVFVEVRYRYDESHAHPLDTFTYPKRRAMKRTVMYYLMKHAIPEEHVRIDFIWLMPKKDGTIGHRLWHVKGAEV
jgi:putative endonuclease